ncbi:MAG: hypothetical protein BAJALOKI2v1_420008 [Promethearchaeota archaeon]|nr:MAG: hypothetical protein BAJALOKI2v1_420008 [Candidatus Lokiarchaeota archaeon]
MTKNENDVEEKSHRRGTKYYINTITHFLNENPSGVTITDIAEGIESSRVTVGKYIAIMLERDTIEYKKIGAYKLYYNSKQEQIPSNLVFSYFSGFLTGIKEINLSKEKLKTIGSTIADFMDFPYGSKFPDEILPDKSGSFIDFYEYFGEILPFVRYIYRNGIKVETDIHEEENKAYYTIKNVNNLDKFLDVHFYIMTGVIEKTIFNKLNKKSVCQVEDIDIDKKQVKLSLKIS